MGRIFGTDGVRGIANRELSPELVFRLGRAVASFLKGKGERPRLVVGRDTRISGGMLEAALASGVASTGVDVVSLGVITTPGVAYLVRRLGAAGGAMISASHNPFMYNGIKFFSPHGFKFPDEVEDGIEALLAETVGSLPRPIGPELGRIEVDETGADLYMEALAATSPEGLAGLKVVVDAAHGAACRLAPLVFSRLGAEVKMLNVEPDGLNINQGCGSLHPDSLRRAVREEAAAAGLAFDGDADRMIAVDEKGDLVDGDHIMAIAGLYLSRRRRLPGRAVVGTVMSNMGLERVLAREGISLIRTRVGDRYVLEEMLRGNHNLGGEQSGHIIFRDHSTTGDGLLTGIQLLKIMREEGRPLSELAGVVVKYPQVLVNVAVGDTAGFKGRLEAAPVAAAVRRAEKELGEDGRILIRPSGTEPLVRVMVEGEDEDRINRVAEDLADLIRRELV